MRGFLIMVVVVASLGLAACGEDCCADTCAACGPVIDRIIFIESPDKHPKQIARNAIGTRAAADLASTIVETSMQVKFAARGRMECSVTA